MGNAVPGECWIFIVNALRRGAIRKTFVDGRFKNTPATQFNFIFSLTRYEQRGKM